MQILRWLSPLFAVHCLLPSGQFYHSQDGSFHFSFHNQENVPHVWPKAHLPGESCLSSACFTGTVTVYQGACDLSSQRQAPVIGTFLTCFVSMRGQLLGDFRGHRLVHRRDHASFYIVYPLTHREPEAQDLGSRAMQLIRGNVKFQPSSSLTPLIQTPYLGMTSFQERTLFL